ncbi:MAG: hypothetical protein GY919_00305 [Photobacterium aquimaris]|nr:hypothetical protein [Photobacterium aquimaris]
MSTPVAMQPTEYIRVSWEGRGHGNIANLFVSAVHDGEFAAVRMQWESAEKHPKDAVAIALPVRGTPPLVTMGMKGSPINMLHWMAKDEGVRSVFAEGIGTTALGPNVKASASASWKDGVWSVVITRALGFGDDVAPLIDGEKTGIGFAVWNGVNQERAGIKAFSVNWLDFILDA